MARARIIPSVLEYSRAATQRCITSFARISDALHLDLMDGSFVPTRSVMPDDIVHLTVPLHTTAHLMVNAPVPWINAGYCIGIRSFVLHVESAGVTPQNVRALSPHLTIRMAINPGTPERRLTPYLPFIHGIHVMTVHPGRQGSRFIPEQLAVISRLHARHPRLSISVDGGMNRETIPATRAAGADMFIVGSALSRAPRPASELAALTRLIGR